MWNMRLGWSNFLVVHPLPRKILDLLQCRDVTKNKHLAENFPSEWDIFADSHLPKTTILREFVEDLCSKDIVGSLCKLLGCFLNHMPECVNLIQNKMTHHVSTDFIGYGRYRKARSSGIYWVSEGIWKYNMWKTSYRCPS